MDDGFYIKGCRPQRRENIMELQPRTEHYGYEQISIFYIVDRFGAYWYDALKLAEVLEYADPYQAIIIHVNHKGKAFYQDIPMNDPIYGMQNGTVFVNVSGVTSLIYASKKPISEFYKKWVSTFLLPNVKRIYLDSKLKGITNLQQLETRQLALDKAHQIMKTIIMDIEPDISVKTDDVSLHHQLIILKNPDDNIDMPFYCIRSQKHTIPSQMKNLKTEYIKVLKLDYCPNPVSLFNKLEEEGVIERKGNHFTTDLSEEDLIKKIKEVADGYSLPAIMNIEIYPKSSLALE